MPTYTATGNITKVWKSHNIDMLENGKKEIFGRPFIERHYIFMCWNIYKRMGRELLNVYWQTILSLAYTWVNYIFM